VPTAGIHLLDGGASCRGPKIRIHSPPAASQFKRDFPPLFVPIPGSAPVELGLISGHGRDQFESRAGNGSKRRQIADSSSEPLTMPGDPEPHLPLGLEMRLVRMA
jgi:hypothetical protein